MTAENKQWLQDNMGMNENEFTDWVNKIVISQVYPKSCHDTNEELVRSESWVASYVETMKRGREIMNKHHEEMQIKFACSLPDEVFQCQQDQ